MFTTYLFCWLFCRVFLSSLHCTAAVAQTLSWKFLISIWLYATQLHHTQLLDPFIVCWLRTVVCTGDGVGMCELSMCSLSLNKTFMWICNIDALLSMECLYCLRTKKTLQTITLNLIKKRVSVLNEENNDYTSHYNWYTAIKIRNMGINHRLSRCFFVYSHKYNFHLRE